MDVTVPGASADRTRLQFRSGTAACRSQKRFLILDVREREGLCCKIIQMNMFIKKM